MSDTTQRRRRAMHEVGGVPVARRPIRLANSVNSGDPNAILQSWTETGGVHTVTVAGGTALTHPEQGAWHTFPLLDLLGNQVGKPVPTPQILIDIVDHAGFGTDLVLAFGILSGDTPDRTTHTYHYGRAVYDDAAGPRVSCAHNGSIATQIATAGAEFFRLNLVTSAPNYGFSPVAWAEGALSGGNRPRVNSIANSTASFLTYPLTPRAFLSVYRSATTAGDATVQFRAWMVLHPTEEGV